MRAVTSALLLGTLLAAGACGTGEPAAPRPTRIVLITIDTLRPDHCSLYGYRRRTTPFLDELAAHATVFENAYSTASWTAPAMASLFTSLPPRAHGVVRGFLANGKITSQDLLADQFQTLAEALASGGFQTFGVSTNAHLTNATGFAQGFTELTSLWWEDAEQANAAALAFKERLRAAERSFLWVHYFDPHYPYLHREPWYDTFQAEPDDPQTKALPPAVVKGFREMVDGYDSEIAAVDDNLRRLFGDLGIDSSALVVVVSDHGEAFFEHGTLSHGQSLFEEEIRIPLLVQMPGEATGRRVAALVSLADVFPTILDAVGLPIEHPVEGRSLVPAVRGDALADGVIVTQLDRGAVSHHAVRSGDWKLYRRTPPEKPVGLFDLPQDRREGHDLSGSEPDRVRDLDREWSAFVDRWPPFTAPRKVEAFGKDQIDRLRALGYLDHD